LSINLAGPGPIKLDAVCYYLEGYTKALTQKKFDLWYVDVFAGTGDRTNEKLTGGLLERQPVQWVTETLPGSAKRALNIRPAFKHFIFNESNGAHNKALLALKEANKSLDIEIIGDDANAAVKEIFSRPVGKASIGRARCRPVERHMSAPKQSEYKQRERKRAASNQRRQNQAIPAHLRTMRQIGRGAIGSAKKPSPSLTPVMASHANRAPWKTSRPEKQSTSPLAWHCSGALDTLVYFPPRDVIRPPDQEDVDWPDRISP
jgi:hypothetical protein